MKTVIVINLVFLFLLIHSGYGQYNLLNQYQGYKEKVIFPYIEKCTKKAEEGKMVHVNYGIAECNYLWTPLYDLSVKNKRIRISTSVSFNEGVNEALLTRLKNSVTCARSFYSEYKIDLDLEFRSSRGLKAYHHIDLHEDLERPNIYNWSSMVGGKELTDNEMCALVIHEIGHIFGLVDEYTEEGCDRRISMEQELSIMADSYSSWNNVAFYPRHMETMLGPLCGDFPYELKKPEDLWYNCVKYENSNAMDGLDWYDCGYNY